MIKYFITAALLLFSLTSCDPDSAIARYHRESEKANKLGMANNRLSKQNDELAQQIKEKEVILNALNQGKPPHYVVTVSVAVSRFSLDLFEHMKDSANAGSFDIPVSREFYESVTIGDKLMDGFKAGSFILHGSFSSWDIRIKSKNIR